MMTNGEGIAIVVMVMAIPVAWLVAVIALFILYLRMPREEFEGMMKRIRAIRSGRG